MDAATQIYDRTLIGVFKENSKVLRDMVKESNDLYHQARERKYCSCPRPQAPEQRRGHGALLRAGGRLPERDDQGADAHHASGAPNTSHNNHEGLSKEQTDDLMHINDDAESIYRHINHMLGTGDFSDIEMVLSLRDQLFESIADAIKSELTRINNAQSNTKASMLYLTILNETKSMVLQSRNLLKSQQYFLAAQGRHDPLDQEIKLRTAALRTAPAARTNDATWT